VNFIDEKTDRTKIFRIFNEKSDASGPVLLTIFYLNSTFSTSQPYSHLMI